MCWFNFKVKGEVSWFLSNCAYCFFLPSLRKKSLTCHQFFMGGSKWTDSIQERISYTLDKISILQAIIGLCQRRLMVSCVNSLKCLVKMGQVLYSGGTERNSFTHNESWKMLESSQMCFNILQKCVFGFFRILGHY